MFTPPADWIENPPEDLETIVGILDIYADDIKEHSDRGVTLRQLFKSAQAHYEKTVTAVKENDPQAFFQPSYEQALLLNCWVWGINFPICFAANRIGKTTAFVFNGILWIFPNNGGWKCFKPNIDHLGRTVYLIERPNIEQILVIQDYLKVQPHLMGDPYKQPYESENRDKFKELQRCIPKAFESPYPAPPMPISGQIWLGAPDNDFHKHIIMPRWRSLLPKPLVKDSESDRIFVISTRSETNPKETTHEIICKSYESEDTKWSGDAVNGIILTEGFDQATLNEVKNRITGHGFMSWDYTPAEPRNQGKKVNLAYRVFQQKEELPLQNFPFLKFSVRQAPDFIIPKNKREDMIRMWEDKAEGAARLEGNFFASSGLVLDALDKPFHCLDNWTIRDLQLNIPNGRFYRGFDSGFDHPSVCVWAYLAPNNVWFIYRVYSKRGTTIAERCEDIIMLSNNDREKYSRSGQTFYREIHPFENSEVFVLTAADYHIFKTDEVSGQNYSNQYTNEGLVLTEATHMGPEERATKTNTLLKPSSHPYLSHPIKNTAPGSRIYFLTKGYGVAQALEKFDNLFWDRFKAGDLRGEPKDKVPIHGDDELDGLSYVVCGPYSWSQHEPKRRQIKDAEPDFDRRRYLNNYRENHGLSPDKVATLQQAGARPGYFG